MAQKDAAEQVKEVLRQIVKYRFWISISVAALVAPIAYFMGSGPVQQKAIDETNKITGAEKKVKDYTSPAIPTKEYEPIVAEKTQVLSKDVNSAWKTLFDRQAPLLTWPETVQERFRKWGRQWPENTDPRKIEIAIVDYIEAYPSYVSMVYKTLNPFDYESGEGVVVAPSEDELLRPAKFDPVSLPGLGKVWAAQERLWIQRTMLEVVAQVNKNAKSWDTGVIRQIVALDVGNPNAQDQRSAAKNEALEEAPSIHAPGETDETAATASFGGAGGGIMERMRGARGGAMGGAALGGVGDDNVYYVKATSDKGQYKILPVVMTVLIDQDRVQDFLIELENSPMSIQVMDFELRRPQARVVKPEKGAEFAGGGPGGMMGMMGGANSLMARRMVWAMGGMTGFGGSARQMEQQMEASMRASSMQRMSGMMGMGGLETAKRQGKDVRGENRSKKREEKQKAIEQSKGPSLFDPYFDIVEVTIYGQARFFNPPPVEPAAQPSPGEASAAPAAPGSPAGSEAAKGAPAQSPPGAADRPEQDKAAPKAADGAAPKGKDEAQDTKPVPKAADGAAAKGEADSQDTRPAPKAAGGAAAKGEADSQDTRPAPKAGAAKTQPEGATAKP